MSEIEAKLKEYNGERKCVFTCNLCTKVFKKESFLERHIIKVHSHSIPQVDGLDQGIDADWSEPFFEIYGMDEGRDEERLDDSTEDLEDAVDEGAPEEETEVRESLLPCKCGFCNFRAQTGGEVLIHSRKVHFSRKVH